MKEMNFCVLCYFLVCVLATEYEVKNEITDAVFPQIVLIPDQSTISQCKFELIGIFESEALLGLYDPTSDSEIANTRVPFDGISWVISNGIVIGVPSISQTTRQNIENSTASSSETSSDIAPTQKNVPFDSLKLETSTTENEGGKLNVYLNGYDWDSTTSVLVFEWKISSEYTIHESDITRNKRVIKAGGCLYNAGIDATEINYYNNDNDNSIRCEVRSMGDTSNGAAIVYQSYVHFSGDIKHENITFGATVRQTSFGNNSEVSFVLMILCSFILVLKQI